MTYLPTYHNYIHVRTCALSWDLFLQESLAGEVVPDPMEGEQTWPTDEELKATKGGSVHVIFNR